MKHSDLYSELDALRHQMRVIHELLAGPLGSPAERAVVVEQVEDTFNKIDRVEDIVDLLTLTGAEVLDFLDLPEVYVEDGLGSQKKVTFNLNGKPQSAEGVRTREAALAAMEIYKQFHQVVTSKRRPSRVKRPSEA